MRRLIIVTLLMFIAGSLYSGVSQNSNLFEQGKDAYKNEEYQSAINSWKKILDSGQHSASLYFNLGNAHYKLNQIGPSIYYYEKALRLDPNDRDIKNNLAFAENARIDIIEPLPKTIFRRWYERVSGLLSYNGWAVASVVFSTISVFFFLWYYFSASERKKRLLFVTSLVSSVLMLCSLVIAFLLYSDAAGDRPAIIFSESAEVRNEPRLKGESVFILHEGTKVQVIDQDGEWFRVRIADGKDGWIPMDNLKEL